MTSHSAHHIVHNLQIWTIFYHLVIHVEQVKNWYIVCEKLQCIFFNINHHFCVKTRFLMVIQHFPNIVCWIEHDWHSIVPKYSKIGYFCYWHLKDDCSTTKQYVPCYNQIKEIPKHFNFELLNTILGHPLLP